MSTQQNHVEKPLSHCFEKWTVDNCGFLRNPAPPLGGWNMLKHVETCWNPWFSFTTSLNWCRIWQPSMVSHTSIIGVYPIISHYIPMIFPVNPMVKLRKKRGTFRRLQSTILLTCTAASSSRMLPWEELRTWGVRRELWRTLVMELVKKEWNHRYW